jgi:hypothetical protein
MGWDLYNRVVGEARPRSWGRNTTEKQVTAVIAAVARNCAARFDEDECWKIVNRGAMASLLDDTMTTKTKQKLSGPWSAQQNTKKKIDAVVEAIRNIETREGRRCSKPSLIAELAVQKIASRSTLYKLWDTVRSLVDRESETVDGKKVIHNAPNCTGSFAESLDRHEVLPESIGAQERMILPPALHTKNAVRPTQDLRASACASRGSAPTCKAADRSISKKSCSASTQMSAQPERALASTPTGTHWAAQNTSDDAVLYLMQRLSKLQDAPPRLPLGDVPTGSGRAMMNQSD